MSFRTFRYFSISHRADGNLVGATPHHFAPCPVGVILRFVFCGFCVLRSCSAAPFFALPPAGFLYHNFTNLPRSSCAHMLVRMCVHSKKVNYIQLEDYFGNGNLIEVTRETSNFLKLCSRTA